MISNDSRSFDDGYGTWVRVGTAVLCLKLSSNIVKSIMLQLTPRRWSEMPNAGDNSDTRNTMDYRRNEALRGTCSKTYSGIEVERIVRVVMPNCCDEPGGGRESKVGPR